jgi:hypothetical protein
LGELAEVIGRIIQRLRKAISPFLIQDGNGQPLSVLALRSRFDKARKLAGVSFQFRNIRPRRPRTRAIWRTRRSFSHTRTGT